MNSGYILKAELTGFIVDWLWKRKIRVAPVLFASVTGWIWDRINNLLFDVQEIKEEKANNFRFFFQDEKNWNTWTMNFQMFKLVLEKAEEPEIKLPTSVGSSKKQESSRKTSISALLTMPKPLTVWITISCWNFCKRWEYQTTWPASWETYMQVRKQQLELDMEQQTGSK